MFKCLSNAHKSSAMILLMVFYCQTILSAYEPWRTCNQKIISYEWRFRNISRNTANKIVTAVVTDSTVQTPFASPNRKTKKRKAEIGGPTQPEMTGFKSVNDNNMVDLFSGDFSYNIPLLDVGGYPVNLFYRSGITMDQEASWVGLGWNINPGTITRNLRGIPDDFDGKNDTIQKATSIAISKTIGGDVGADVEIIGLPIVKAGLGFNYGVFYNNYHGWGLENGLDASIKAGFASMGSLSAGLSVTNNSQQGVNISPSLSVGIDQKFSDNYSSLGGGVSIGGGFSYSSRGGLISNLSTGVNLSVQQGIEKNSATQLYGSYISFASPSYSPSSAIPLTNNQFTFTCKIGLEAAAVHPSIFLKGYVTKQSILPSDIYKTYPAYGYLYYQDANDNQQALLDFNREKDVIYRESPPAPNIAVPSYTYDIFNITAEGSGGMFRVYRGDIGYVHDPYVTSKDNSGAASVDFGGGYLFHGGIDINVNHAMTSTGSWVDQNPLANIVRFKQNDSVYEATYLRNPGEKSINAKGFYKNIGDDDVVTAQLYQSDNSPVILSTNSLQRWKNRTATNTSTLLNSATNYKSSRDKRTQIISYLSAAEASRVGLDTMLNNYGLNQWGSIQCSNVIQKESRINSFRQSNHMSEVDVLNADGRKYVYGLPVYNLIQKEVTFASDSIQGVNKITGMVKYASNDASENNHHGVDNYFQREIIGSYTHSFLLTGILSPDYVDLTGNGISDDDLGDAIRFNYTKVAGQGNVFGWRTPYVQDSATYNEGLQTYVRDDKGNYIYGEKEMWYLNSVESKNMVAVFILQSRSDLRSVTETGVLTDTTKAKCLKEIDLYSKSDYIQNGVKAKPIKVVHFFYTYDLCKGINGNTAKGKLTLKKVWFTYNGNDKGIKNPYLFFYNGNNPSYSNAANDRWGNYKNPLQNPRSSQSNVITNIEYPYALQDSVQANLNATAWTMDSVILPSSGSIKVGYESDDYAYVQNKRAAQMFNVVGLSSVQPTSISSTSNALYTLSGTDNLFVSIRVTNPLYSAKDVFQQYLDGFQKVYFKLKVQMPTDQWGNGYEYIPVYADLDVSSKADSSHYGVLGGSTTVIWIKLKGISLDGTTDGSYSPLVKATTQFLRMNLPSKAYPGYEINNKLDLSSAVEMIRALGSNIINAFASFDKVARGNGWGLTIDTSRTLVRLNNPIYKKYGGGHRVKFIKIYDNWKNMTDSSKQSVYGQVYDYTTVKNINGVDTRISSGVASWEPILGHEENPFIVPLEYIVKVAPLAPVSMGYTELPLGETLFPAPSVGYSQVRVNSIHSKNIKSATGYEETKFYTSYDFPTITDNSLFTPDTKKRYKTSLSDFLRIRSYHYLTMSQGFKVELNDMNGKLKTQATYAQTDSLHPIASSMYYYHVDDQNSEFKHLNNTLPTVDKTGNIDTTTILGKDEELMIDMREQHSLTEGVDYGLNVDIFTIFVFPIVLPSNIPMPQKEETRFRSIATTKVIQRFGILDSIVAIDKGSKVSTNNLLYDSETGDVLLTRTKNEFNDTLYNFNYPAHWVYSGVGLAYQNIGAIYKSDAYNDLKIVNGVLQPNAKYPGMLSRFESGDEILATAKLEIGLDSTTTCAGQTGCPKPVYSNNPDIAKIWVIDSKKINPTSNLGIVFIDRYGNPFNADSVTLKIIRSGHRNLLEASAGAITMLRSPIKIINNKLQLIIDSNKNILVSSAVNYNDFYKVADAKRALSLSYNCTCGPLKILFDYLITAQKLFIQQSDNITVDSLVHLAILSGYSVNINDCPLLLNNKSRLFYALTNQTSGPLYQAKIGDAVIEITSDNSSNINFYSLQSKQCSTDNSVHYQDNSSFLVNYKIYNSTSSSYTYAFIGCTQGYYGYTLKPNWDTCVWAFKGKIYPPNITGVDTVAGFCSGNVIPCGTSDIYLSIKSCDSCTNFTCIDPITDTTTNPYAYGILGNWRPQRTYVYFSNRRESLTSNITDIRNNGVIQNFISYWSFGNSYLTATTDTTTYVWNAQSTLFNRKGFEIENKDPLGRYNSGSYGFNETLPIDVVQNSKYKDQFFDGFEDYSYTSQTCSQNCSVARYVNFAKNTDTVTKNIAHSGKYSLRVNDSSYVVVPIAYDSASINPNLTIQWKNSNKNDTTVNPKGSGVFDTTYISGYITRLQAYIQCKKTGYYHFNANGYGVDSTGSYSGCFITLSVGGVSDTKKANVSLDLNVTIYLIAGNLYDCYLTTNSGPYYLKLNYPFNLSLKWSNACDIPTLVQIPTTSIYKYTGYDSSNSVIVSNVTACSGLVGIRADSSALMSSFTPTKGMRMVFGAWVKEQKDCLCQSYDSNRVNFTFTRSNHADTILSFKPRGNLIEGWQRYDTVITVPSDATSMRLVLKSTSSNPVYFDDVRMYPYNANMKSFVYDPTSLRLMAELDENNYATFYEYDDDGTLIRVKKETERGIQTIKETRSSLSQLYNQ